MTSKAKRRRAWRQRVALPIIALVLAASAGVRLATGTGAAIAREVEAMVPHSDSPGQLGLGGTQCQPDPEIAPILERLLAREAEVAAAEARISERERALSAAEQRIGERLDALKSAEDSLSATMARSNTASETDLVQLTTVYETMKPKEAIPLFEAMEPEFAAGFLGRMRADAAAAVLAGMQPEKAYAVSVILAGRNARAAKE